MSTLAIAWGTRPPFRPAADTESTRMTDDAQKRKAALIPITGRYEAFAHEVRRLLGWEEGSERPFLSTRNAARKAALSNGTIAAMAQGDQAKPESVDKFAAAFRADAARMRRLNGHVSPEEVERMSRLLDDPLLAVGPEIDLSFLRSVPMSASFASAGEGQTLDTGDYEAALAAVPGGTRAIWVRGDCMEPFYQDGDLIFVRQTPAAAPGEVVVARLDGETVACKMYRIGEDGPYLEAVNGQRRIGGRFEIVGVVEAFLRMRRPPPTAH